MKIPDGVLRLLLRPRVRHSLPGRLRVQIPLTGRAARARAEIVQLILDLLREPDEIHDVSGSTVTGTLLIHYDPARAKEADVLGYLDALLEIYLANRSRLDALPLERWPEVRDRLVPLVRGAIRHRLTLDRQLEIGTDVLA
jgi:hypothetical protein